MVNTSRKVKIFALPFGGGNKYSYRALERLVPDNFEWETIELPGRGVRIGEPLLTDIHAMAEDAFKQIRLRLYNADYLLYGHSMGTLLAYELTKKICFSGLPRPACLFLTGREAPGVNSERKIADYEKNAFWQEVEKLGGLPKEISGNNELKDFFEPVLRSDFKAIEEYVYQAMEQPFPVPVFIRYGKEEGISCVDIAGWQKETAFPLDAHVFPGDHFFIFQHPEQLMMEMSKAYSVSKTRLYPEISRYKEPLLNDKNQAEGSL